MTAREPAPACSAIVNHWGAGTWAAAAVYGVRQVAPGWIRDAVYRARRLEALGAGLRIPSFELTSNEVVAELERLVPLYRTVYGYSGGRSMLPRGNLTKELLECRSNPEARRPTTDTSRSGVRVRTT
jgi:hypothetical protein